MTISMYQASVPAFVRALNNLAAILEKGAAHAQTNKIDEALLLSSRLFPDMHPLTRQVQLASETAKVVPVALRGRKFQPSKTRKRHFRSLDSEFTIPLLTLQTLRPEQIDGSEAKTVSWQTRSSTKSMQGLPYLMYHVLPNVHFHVTTAYAILRHNGVTIGKKDFLGP